MINLLLGSSGGGKSFEAVVYQILPALEKGRKIITNLPLNVEAFGSINHEFLDLIELRTRPQPIRGVWLPTEDKAFELFSNGEVQQADVRGRVFSKVWDYYDEWKHPETCIGALFVIDECQYSIPRGRTDIQVEEYTALHRHYKVDILYITQSYGKISKTIVDNLQMVYRVRKQSAFGRETHYIRKVQDGVRGQVMSITSREYISAYFQLYKSHTQSTGVGHESGASDVKPIWMHWSFQGSAICFIIFIVFLFSGVLKNPLKPEIPKKNLNYVTKNQPLYEKTVYESGKPDLPQYTTMSNSYDEQEIETIIDHPFNKFGLHITGSYYNSIDDEYIYIVGISQNGQIVETFQDKELTLSGYEVVATSRCVFKLIFETFTDWVTCGQPQQSSV